MDIILALAAAAIMAMRLTPQSRLGRGLSHWLVEEPARLLSRLTRGHAILFVLILAAIWAAIAVAKTEGAFLVAQGLPEGIAFILSFDVSSLVDALALAFLLAASVRLKAVKAAMLSLVQRLAGRRPARAARARRRRTPRSPAPSNDDEPAAWPLAA